MLCRSGVHLLHAVFVLTLATECFSCCVSDDHAELVLVHSKDKFAHSWLYVILVEPKLQPHTQREIEVCHQLHGEALADQIGVCNAHRIKFVGAPCHGPYLSDVCPHVSYGVDGEYCCIWHVRQRHHAAVDPLMLVRLQIVQGLCRKVKPPQLLPCELFGLDVVPCDNEARLIPPTEEREGL